MILSVSMAALQSFWCGSQKLIGIKKYVVTSFNGSSHHTSLNVQNEMISITVPVENTS